MASVVDVSMGASGERDPVMGRPCEEPEWKVEDFYSKDGVWQAVARKDSFKSVFHALTAMFLVWIAIEMDFNASPSLRTASPIFQIVAYVFFLVFCFDVLIRFLAFSRKANIFKHDGMLVWEMMLTVSFFLYIVLGGLSTNPDGGMKFALKLSWLSQSGRIARLMKEVPELLVLVKCMWDAARSVFFTICLMAMLLYIFSLFLCSFSRESKFGETHFPTVPRGEWTLLLKLVFFQNLGDFLEEARAESVGLVILILVALLILASVLFMGIGVLLEVVKMVSLKEKDILICKWLMASSRSIISTTVGEQCMETGMTQAHINVLFSNMQFVQFLTSAFKSLGFFSTGAMGLDLIDLKGLVDMQFDTGKPVVTQKELMCLVVELSGPNAATMKSMLRMRQFMAKQQ